jgi:hypothetical protein
MMNDHNVDTKYVSCFAVYQNLMYLSSKNIKKKFILIHATKI